MQGAVKHVLGSLMAPGDHKPSFASLYIHDPAMELENRLINVNNKDPQMIRLMKGLQEVMHDCSPFIQAFKNGTDQLKSHPNAEKMRLVLSSDCMTEDAHIRTYNAPTADEVAAIFTVSENVYLG